MITLRTLLTQYRTKAAVAAAFGVTKQAVSQWPMDGPIPKQQELKIKYERLLRRSSLKKTNEHNKGA